MTCHEVVSKCRFVAVSLAELKQAVHKLSPTDLAELAAFIREENDRAWDSQIDEDFSPCRKLHGLLGEVRNDLRAGHVMDLP